MKYDTFQYQPSKHFHPLTYHPSVKTSSLTRPICQDKTTPPDSAEWPAFSYVAPTMTGHNEMSEARKAQLIAALETHQINTLQELRRVEKLFAEIGTPDVSGPMTSAWSYYVNSNMLLTELRGLTTNYPFSSHCLEEAKRRVYADPESNRSWNFCWLVLTKIQTDQLVPYYAIHQASQREMWGTMTPTQQNMQQLAGAFNQEWTSAVDELLMHWDDAPVGSSS